MAGSAKVDLPSPPYIVPSSENSAVFCEIGSSWPWHKAQPVGGKLNAKMVISATKGELIAVHSASRIVAFRRRPAQFWLGYTPNSEMMKLSTSIDCRFSCGWLPP